MLNSKDVINEHISTGDLRAYFVGFDLKIFRYEPLTEVLMNSIVDFAFGFHTGILKKYDREQLKEAAKSIYRIKQYSDSKEVYLGEEISSDEEEPSNNRGEFGELILHVILRDFLKTVPLLSKIYFKDTDGATVHGFDAVHIGPDPNSDKKKSLFFGESKLYSRKKGNAGEAGINDLVKDIKNHFKTDFLFREFALIYKKRIGFESIDNYEDKNTLEEYKTFLKEKDYWYNLLNETEKGRKKLTDFLNSVTITLLCTYQSKVLSDHFDENTAEFKEEYDAEIKQLKKTFDKKLKEIKDKAGEPIKTDLNIVLMLFPIPNKRALVKMLHQKLSSQQNA